MMRKLFLGCNVSEKEVGAVLLHKEGRIEFLIAFAAKKLKPAEAKYFIINHEALVILSAITKFDQYLRGAEFNLITDHKPLTWIGKNPSKTR